MSHERTDRRSTSELLNELKETAAPTIAGLAADERADVDEIVAMLTGNFEKIAEHGRRADGVDAYRMVRRRTAGAGFKVKLGCHAFRATGITAHLEGAALENAQATAAHESPRTTRLYGYRRRLPDGRQLALSRPGSVRLIQDRALTTDSGRFNVPRARLAPAMISTPGHWASRRRQRGALPAWSLRIVIRHGVPLARSRVLLTWAPRISLVAQTSCCQRFLVD